MPISFFDGQALSATQLQTAFDQTVKIDADGSNITVVSGTSGTARSLKQRFQDVINVLDFMPAPPNGTLDNSVAIRAAIAAAAGVARLFFPITQNPYLVTALDIPSNSHLVIDGTIKLITGGGGSVLRMTSVSNIVIEGSGVIDGNMSGQSAAQHGITAASTSGLTIRGLAIQHCYQSPFLGSACSGVLIDDCDLITSGKPVQFTTGSSDTHIRNCLFNNIADTSLLYYGGVTNSSVTDCTLVDSTLHGILVYNDAANPVPCNDLTVSNCTIHNSGSCGINIDQGTGATGLHSTISIKGNRIYANNTSNIAGFGGIRTAFATGVHVSNNQITKNGAGSNATFAISVGSSSTHITSNQIANEAQGSTVGIGILLTVAANNVSVSDNQIIDDQAIATMQYGISGTCGTGARIYDNTITGMRTSKYASLTLASDTIISELNDHNVLTMTGPFATTSAVCDLSAVVVTPTTGFSVTIPAGCASYIMTPAGTLASGTLIMPVLPFDGQIIFILSTQAITSFTLSPNSGQTISGAPTAIQGNTGHSFIYAGTVWYCRDANPGTGGIVPATVRVITAAGGVAATGTDNVIVLKKTTGAATTVTLPASPVTGFELTIKDGKGDAGTNFITITPNAGTIDGAANIILSTNYASVSLLFDGSNWAPI
jgi:hypothetical protein